MLMHSSIWVSCMPKAAAFHKNDSQAVLWYGRAAEQNNARAQFNLAVMYESGRGVEQSAERAEYWYSEAAKSR